MTWNVRLYAHLREKHGDLVTIESEPTVTDVFAALRQAGISTQSCRLAADTEFVREGDSLSEGQDLALIPPVSGG